MRVCGPAAGLVSSELMHSSVFNVNNVHCFSPLLGIVLMRKLLAGREVLLWGFTNCGFNTEGTHLEPDATLSITSRRSFPVCCSSQGRHSCRVI